MVKSLNVYKVLDRGWTFANQLNSIEDVQSVIAYSLQSRGFSKQESESLSQDLSTFLKPNVYDVRLVAYPANQLVEIPKQSQAVNNMLFKFKAFNGKALKHNSPESCKRRYKPGQFAVREVKFAESVFSSKGQSVIFKQTKKQKNEGLVDLETYEKVSKLTDQGYFDDKMSVTTVIQKLLVSLSPCDVYRQLKGKVNLGSNELNKLIYKIKHQ